ncbi:MAG TPA: CoA transferase [bacterium]|nr:CoA transferase [bacterium]
MPAAVSQLDAPQTAPLASYRVLDLSDQQGWLCGRLLADLGCDVVKIEPPGGDEGRRFGPFWSDAPDPEACLPWLAYNANKRGITLDVGAPRGRDLLRRLAVRADFLIETYRPGYLDAQSIGYAALRDLNPRLVVTSITPFGQTGPYAGYHSSDLVAMAMSGFMSLVGEPGRPPLRVSLPQAPMWAGMHAAAGTLIAHYAREATGRGQHVDASTQAALLWALANAPAYWSLGRNDLHRGGTRIVGRSTSGAAMRAIYRCRDGHINFILYGGEAGQRSNEGMVRWMTDLGEAPEWLRHKDWRAFNVATATQAEVDDVEEPFAAFLARRTKAEFSAASLRYEILGYPVADARDIRTDEQLAARGFWQAVEHPERGAAVTYPGPFARFSGATARIRRRAPRIGEHNNEVYRGELELPAEDLEGLRRQGVI